MRKSILAAAAAFALAGGAMVGQAAAADLYVAPPPLTPPPPVFVPTWAGFYVGGHIGYGEGTSDYRQDVDIFDAAVVAVIPPSFNTFRDSVNPDGIIGGVQGGYNWQMNNFVFGIEGDFSFADWGAGSTVFDSDDGDLGGPFGDDRVFGTSSTDIDFLASIRGRLGYAMDSILIYGTGGVAWADGEARARITIEDGGVVEERSGKGDLSDFGWVAGAGMAWMVIPQTMSIGVEGLYYWFDESETLIDESIVSGTTTTDVRATAELHNAWVVRARADFHF